MQPSRLCGNKSRVKGSSPDNDPPSDGIFYFEALVVLSTLIEAVCHIPSPARVVIFSDNMNSVDIFSSLGASPLYNTILKPAVSLLLEHDILL
jgi:hypothetical protein